MASAEKVRTYENEIAVLEKILHELKVKLTVEKWEIEAEGLQKEYPDFRLREAVCSMEFLELLAHGESMKAAYLQTFKGE